MAACPNCGRQTLRTLDWACQWCGYPLVSRAYKKIDKTFKELEAERKQALRSPEPEDAPEVEPEYEPEPEPEPEPPVKPVFRHRTAPEPPPQPPPRVVPQPESRATPQPPSAPVWPPSPPVIPVPPSQPALPKYEPAPQPIQAVPPVPPVIPLMPPKSEPAPIAPPPPQPEVAPAPSVMYTPPPPAPQTPPPAPKPEIRIEPQPAPAIKLDAIQDGMEITADQIDALFRTEKAGANSKLTGKTLVIRGIVERVFIREHLEIRYIMLTGSQKRMNWSLRCTFNKEESSKLTRLNEGQEVLVRGKYDGYSKNIIFKDCALG